MSAESDAAWDAYEAEWAEAARRAMAKTKRRAELAAIRKLFGDQIQMRARLLENAERTMLASVAEVKRRQAELDDAATALEQACRWTAWEVDGG